MQFVTYHSDTCSELHYSYQGGLLRRHHHVGGDEGVLISSLKGSVGEIKILTLPWLCKKRLTFL